MNLLNIFISSGDLFYFLRILWNLLRACPSEGSENRISSLAVCVLYSPWRVVLAGISAPH